MKLLMWYRRDRAALLERAFISEVRSAGYDGLIYIIKDYNGTWIGQDEARQVELLARAAGLRLFGWVCCMTEGYSGALAETGEAPEFVERKWSVIDSGGHDTNNRPIECDRGLEQYACPSNHDHTRSIVDNLRQVDGYGIFEGYLFDFVRYPLELEYCYCPSCDDLSGEMFCRPVSQLSNFERYTLRNEGVRRFVAEAANATPERWTTYLVWPDLGVRDLRRSQAYGQWPVDRIGPMLYPTLGESWVSMLSTVKRRWPKEVSPLLLSANPLVSTFADAEAKAETIIVTHYSMSSWSESAHPTERNVARRRLRRMAYSAWAGIRYYAAAAENMLHRRRPKRPEEVIGARARTHPALGPAADVSEVDNDNGDKQ